MIYIIQIMSTVKHLEFLELHGELPMLAYQFKERVMTDLYLNTFSLRKPRLSISNSQENHPCHECMGRLILVKNSGKSRSVLMLDTSDTI
jgi:hypothetical protein